MHKLIYQFAVMLVVLGISSTAFASAEKTDSTLDIFLDFRDPSPDVSEPFDQSAKIVVDDGTVTIFGVPDDATGTLFDGEMFLGITTIVVDTGVGNDKVSFEIVTMQDLFNISVDSTDGQAETKIKMAVPSGAWLFSSNINLAFGNLEDKLELELNSQRDTNLLVNAMGSSGEKSIAVKAMYGSGTDVNNMFMLGLGGFEDDTIIEIKSEASELNNIFMVDSGPGEDLTRFVIEHLGVPTNTMLSHNNALMLSQGGGEDTTDIIIKSPNASVGLSGMINAGAADNKVNIEVDAPDVVVSNLNVMAESGRDELNGTFKGNVNVVSGSLTLSAGDGDDKLKLLVVGELLGSATLDGGDGFDECEASPDVTLVPAPSCDIAKQ